MSQKPRNPASPLLVLQGLYFLVTGVWPLVSIDTFQAVTGPKTDLWLVRTVGALVAVVGGALLSAAREARVSVPVALLGIGSAVALTAIDVIYVEARVIDPIYLVDAAAEGVLLIGWSAALLIQGRQVRPAHAGLRGHVTPLAGR